MIGQVITAHVHGQARCPRCLVVGTYWAQLTMICRDLRLSSVFYIRVIPAFMPFCATV